MSFPLDAAYGPQVNPAALAAWDGRDDNGPCVRDIVQEASRDDDAGHACEGYECEIGALEVLRKQMLQSHGLRSRDLSRVARELSDAEGRPKGRPTRSDAEEATCDEGEARIVNLVSSPRMSSRGGSGGVPSWTLSAEEALFESTSDAEEEDSKDACPVSPHIDTSFMSDCKVHHSQQPQQPQQPQLQPHQAQQPQQLPSVGNSPSSANSLMLDLSDLEHLLNDEVSTVRGWMARVKAERDRLSREKTGLAQRLAAETEARRKEQAEAAEGAARRDREVKDLREELAERERAAARGEVAREEREAAAERQLHGFNQKVAALEEALVQEKSTAALREAIKVEECREEHFGKLSAAMVDLEDTFRDDLAKMTALLLANIVVWLLL